ncbi:hypothetical protein AAG570_000911 [Ranatra chinensis]|uniref:Uncharacterized protein n=1 Tax=Ranatra chinensis TaxID=642074 RepID=A0ABD0YYG5_9HEMI
MEAVNECGQTGEWRGLKGFEEAATGIVQEITSSDFVAKETAIVAETYRETRASFTTTSDHLVTFGWDIVTHPRYPDGKVKKTVEKGLSDVERRVFDEEFSGQPIDSHKTRLNIHEEDKEIEVENRVNGISLDRYLCGVYYTIFANGHMGTILTLDFYTRYELLAQR